MKTKFEKLLKNKHLLIIGIVCLIALTCISLASAAEVNSNINSATNDASNIELK